MKACAPASDHAFFPACSKDPAMPMNMMLMSTPLEPPMVFPRMAERQLQVALGSASGRASRCSSTLLPADAMVEPQSASPTFPSSSSSSFLAPMSASHTFRMNWATSSSLDAATPSMGSRPLTPGTGVGKDGATAFGQAATSVGAARWASSSGVRRSRESDTPFMSSEVHRAAGPTMSLREDAHFDFMSAPARMVISCGGTPPRLLMRAA
mmetsp:Transcript_105134/g.327768  ORF Transcript_105134/g.327768 Transcript_105134/m.327768 type:complete len:210 (+) Transcript_105134:355-984(+)